MKESAQAAHSYLRMQAPQLRLQEDFFKTHDLHIQMCIRDRQDAGYTASQVKFFKAKLDRDDGCYDIEFYVRGNVIVEHDYEVDAKTGKILSHDTDIEGYTPNQSSGDRITKAKAKNIALNHAGLSAGKVSFVRVKLDRDDGRWVYEIEFRMRNNRRIEYDYEIDAYTGQILSWDRDYDD